MEYPALTPETRTYTSGRIPIQRRDDLSGAAVRWIRGDVLVGHRLKLSYELGTSLEARRILDHYRTVQGGFIPFKLPSAVWCGSASYPGSTVAGGLSWRYAAQPTIEDDAPGTFSVEVELISVTSELPTRTVAPVEPTVTVTLEVENDPAPPFEPVGPWFRAFRQEVLITSDDVPINVPVRQLFGEPLVSITTAGIFARAYVFELKEYLVEITSGVAALFVEQFNYVTRQITLPESEAIASGNIQGAISGAFEALWAGMGAVESTPIAGASLEQSSQILLTTPSGDVFDWFVGVSLLLPVPIGAGDGGGDYELDILGIEVQGGFAVALTIAFPVAVGSQVDALDRSSAATGIPFDATVGSLVDSTSRESQSVEASFPVTVGGDLDGLDRGGATVGAAIALEATANPSYVDFGTGGADESTAFAWGPSAGPTDIPFDVLVSSPVDMPSRQSEELSVAFPVTFGSLVDFTDRSSLTVEFSLPVTSSSDPDTPTRGSTSVETALSLLASGNPAYIDFTSGSLDEDAGYQELGVTAALDVPFNITVGSLFSPLSRDSTSVAISFTAAAGGDPDTPTRGSAANSIEVTLLATNDNPAYVDFTSGSPDEDAGFKELGASAELAVAFSIAVGSLFSPFTRAGTPLDIAFALTVGGDDDTPTRASQEASISSLDPGLTQPSSFSDLTP